MSSQTTKVLITGITGFIGSSLSQHLKNLPKFQVSGSSRRFVSDDSLEIFQVENLTDKTDWKAALRDVDVVVHIAARAHILNDKPESSLAKFISANVDGTVNLARQAMDAGVKKFIFLSSIGVNGAETSSVFFNEKVPVNPSSEYAYSKYRAECELTELVENSDMKLVIIRPPLVYGIEAPGNFALLLKIIRKGFPLPFRCVKNKRSYISIDNLVSFIVLTISHVKAENETFVISDDDDLSTIELINILSKGMGKNTLLLPFPVSILKWGSKIMRWEKKYQQLCCSLQIDIQKTKDLLNWEPELNAKTSLLRLAEEYYEKSN